MPDERSNDAFARTVFEEGWNRLDFAFLDGRTAERAPMHTNGRTHTTSAAELPGLVAC